MKLDTFITLIKDLSHNAIAEDTDPANIVLNTYASPYDVLSLNESVRVKVTSSANIVWGDGSTYTAYDTDGNPYQAPSCGWSWSQGGIWS